MSTMEDGRHMTERMLQLTLEVIYLLTGEDYSVVKTASLESLFCGVYSSIPGRWSPTAHPAPPSPDRGNKRRIVELRSRLMELLAAQDDDVSPYVERWGYVEGSRDVCEAAMMEAEPQPPGDGPSPAPAQPPAEEKPLPSSGVSSPAHHHPAASIKEELRPCEEESRSPCAPFPSGLTEDEPPLPHQRLPCPDTSDKENHLPLTDSSEETPLPHSHPALCYKEAPPPHSHPALCYKEAPPLHSHPALCYKEAPPPHSHPALCYKEAPPPHSHPALCYKEAPPLHSHRALSYREAPPPHSHLALCYKEAPPPDLFTSFHSEETHCGRVETSHHYEEEELSTSGTSLRRHAENHLRRHDTSPCREEEQPSHSGSSPIQTEKPLPQFGTLCNETSPSERSPPTHGLPCRSPRIKEEPRSCQEEPFPSPGVSAYEPYGTAPGSGEMAFACAECRGRFLSHHELIAHMSTHPGDKPHCCPICRAGFRSLSELEEHRAAYTGRKPYCCCVCQRAFPNKASLSIHHKRHLQGISAALGDGRRGSGKVGSPQHQGEETGRKPYSCFDCGKCFTSYSNLSNHQKIHSGLKPYICSECGKCFVRRFNLVRHMTVHRKKTANHA